ncbi:MAG TPA: DUF2934 domain-containing protein [Kiloniellales bacterium]|nr:DUF2934 domain-containing protein [Kiloniellales bacterium]
MSSSDRGSDKGREGGGWSEEVRRRAEALRREEGDAEADLEPYLERAEELLAIERNQAATLKPNPEQTGEQTGGAETVEPPEALENQGEFPGLADQGEETPAPPHRPEDEEERR